MWCSLFQVDSLPSSNKKLLSQPRGYNSYVQLIWYCILPKREGWCQLGICGTSSLEGPEKNLLMVLLSIPFTYLPWSKSPHNWRTTSPKPATCGWDKCAKKTAWHKLQNQEASSVPIAQGRFRYSKTNGWTLVTIFSIWKIWHVQVRYIFYQINELLIQ